jgi:hypothetical protein
MKKWIERLITAAGIATLVGIFCYQVAYGHTASWGENGYSPIRKEIRCKVRRNNMDWRYMNVERLMRQLQV